MIYKNQLIVEKVTKTYTHNKKMSHVLHPTSAIFHAGTTYAITGASGSGKSTFLHLLGGLDSPSTGSIRFNDEPLQKMQPEKLEHFRQQHLGFVFQFHYLLPDLTVQENIALPAIIAGTPYKKAFEIADKLLEQLDIADKKTMLPHHLSGGQQQRVALLRAMINKPTFLLADEPTGNLDEKQAKHITDLILWGKEEWNMGTIICTHDQSVANIMDHTLHLEHGTLSQRQQLESQATE